MSASNRNYLVLGGGAVGLGLASFLHQAGRRVAVLARGETAAALRRHGLRRAGPLGEHAVPPGGLEVVESLGGLCGASFACAFVCVKSYDSEAVASGMEACPSLLDRRGRVVLCQNGWGNAEVFARRLPPRCILNARVMTGFERTAPNRVSVTSCGRPLRVGSLFGDPSAPSEEVCAELTAAGLPAEAVGDIGRDLWEKMLFSCAVNPLGALFGATVGQLAASRPARRLVARLVGETFAAMRLGGYRSHAASAAEYLDAFYRDLVPALAGHAPSMLQDLRAGRRTEIDALNGAVVRLGERAGIDVTCSRLVCRLIRLAEGRGGFTSVPAGKAEACVAGLGGLAHRGDLEEIGAVFQC